MYHEILKVNPEAGQDEIDAAFQRELALLTAPAYELSSETLMRGLELTHAWLAVSPKERRDRLVLVAQYQSLLSQVTALKQSLREQDQLSNLADLVHKLDASDQEKTRLLRQGTKLMEQLELLFAAREQRLIAENQLLRKKNAELTAKLEDKTTECRLLSEKAAKAAASLEEQRTMGLSAAKELQLQTDMIKRLSAELAKK